MSILKVENLQYYYQDGGNRRYILNNINYEFECGKFYTILGQSGSGKTTLLSIIGGLEQAKNGNVYFKEETLKKIGIENYRRNNIGIIFQSFNLIDYLTAHENVLVSMSTTDNKIEGNKSDIAYNLLDFIGIDKTKANRFPKGLSGGEQQRIAIARALSTNVDIILADEPTGNLDLDTENEIVEIFKDLAKNHNKCIIMVTHSKEIADKSDIVINLKKGVLSTDE